MITLEQFNKCTVEADAAAAADDAWSALHRWMLKAQM